jgi:hypothetical protein
MAVANSLAYYDMATITAVKSFPRLQKGLKNYIDTRRILVAYATKIF